MMRLLLYSVMLMVFIPLTSSGKIRHRAKRHVPESVGIIINSFSTNSADVSDSSQVTISERPLQDTLKNAKRKKIKEVARAKPQSKPEKVKRQPPDKGTDRPGGGPVAGRPGVGQGTGRPGVGQGGERPAPGGRPAGGGQGGGPSQRPPQRPGR